MPSREPLKLLFPVGEGPGITYCEFLSSDAEHFWVSPGVVLGLQMRAYRRNMSVHQSRVDQGSMDFHETRRLPQGCLRCASGESQSQKHQD